MTIKPVARKPVIAAQNDYPIDLTKRKAISPHTFRQWTEIPEARFSCRVTTPLKELTRKLGVSKERCPKFIDETMIRWIASNNSKLGEGTYGTIFTAYDRLTNRPIVAKQFNVNDSKRHDSAVDEAESYRLWRSMQIPHILRFHANVRGRSNRYLFMDRVTQTLYSTLLKGKLPFDRVNTITRQLLEMHKAASKNNVVHGDITPANLGDGEEIRVFDLGMAHQLDERPFEQRFTSLWYSSPEQILGKDYDASTDLWSIGCIAFEMFTGTRLIQADTDLLAMCQIINAIGYPTREYLKQCSKFKEFACVFNKYLASPPNAIPPVGTLTRRIREECAARKLPAEQAEEFERLLRWILTYENRIAPAAALHLCNSLGQLIEKDMQKIGNSEPSDGKPQIGTAPRNDGREVAEEKKESQEPKEASQSADQGHVGNPAVPKEVTVGPKGQGE